MTTQLPSAGTKFTDDAGYVFPTWYRYLRDFRAAAITGTVTIAQGGTGATTASGARTNLGLAIGTNVQAYDASLLSFATLATASDKLAYTTGVDVWAETALTSFARTLIDDSTASDARTTLGLAIGTNVQAFDSTLTAFAAYNTNGLLTQTAADTFTGRTLIGPAAGITVSNGDGVSGNPTLALANDLAALEALSSTGLITRTGSETYAQRTITGTANRITVSNGDGVSGNPTLDVGTNVYLSGGTDVAVADGGTGASTASSARTNLGFADGTYSATFTNVANLDGTPSNTTCQYMQVGNTVTVSGTVTIDPTLTATTTQCGISLPVASDFASSIQCAGTGCSPGITGQVMAIVGDATNNRAEMQWKSTDVTSQLTYFNFTYLIV